MDGSSVTCEAHHAAPRCLLALHEKANVSASILEVLHAPLKAVVPTFLKVKPSEDDTSVTEREKEVLEIKQELELLRREMMPTFRTTPRPEKGSSELVREEVGLAPSPYDARQLIEVYLDSGWPFEEAVTPFTFSLLIYALLLPGLYLTWRGRLMAGYWLFTAAVLLALVISVHFVGADREAPIRDIYAVYDSPVVGFLAVADLAVLIASLVVLAVMAIQALRIKRRE